MGLLIKRMPIWFIVVTTKRNMKQNNKLFFKWPNNIHLQFLKVQITSTFVVYDGNAVCARPIGTHTSLT